MFLRVPTHHALRVNPHHLAPPPRMLLGRDPWFLHYAVLRPHDGYGGVYYSLLYSGGLWVACCVAGVRVPATGGRSGRRAGRVRRSLCERVPPPPNTLMPAAPWLVACSRCACPAACGLTLVLATTLPFERTVATSWFQAVSGRAGEAWAQGGWAPVATSPCAPGLRRARTRAVVAVVLALMHF